MCQAVVYVLKTSKLTETRQNKPIKNYTNSGKNDTCVLLVLSTHVEWKDFIM